jgi:hypothetical protein
MGASIHIEATMEDTREQADRLFRLSNIVPPYEPGDEWEGLHISYGSVYALLSALGLPWTDEDYCGTIDPKVVVERVSAAHQMVLDRTVRQRLVWLYALALRAIEEGRQITWG